MAIAFGSISFTTFDTRTNTTITAPTGITNGDQLLFLIVTAVTGEAVDPTPPGGLTLLGTIGDQTQGGFNQEYRLYRKTASGESGDYTFTHASSLSIGVAVRYSGVDTVTPIDATTTTNSGTGTATSATGITTTTAGVMLVFFAIDFAGGTLSPPTGMTERKDGGPYVADELQAGAGASGNKSQTNNNAGGAPWLAYLVALRPANDTGTVTDDDPIGITEDVVVDRATDYHNDPDEVGIVEDLDVLLTVGVDLAAEEVGITDLVSISVELEIVTADICFDVGAPVFVPRAAFLAQVERSTVPLFDDHEAGPPDFRDRVALVDTADRQAGVEIC